MTFPSWFRKYKWLSSWSRSHSLYLVAPIVSVTSLLKFLPVPENDRKLALDMVMNIGIWPPDKGDNQYSADPAKIWPDERNQMVFSCQDSDMFIEIGKILTCSYY